LARERSIRSYLACRIAKAGLEAMQGTETYGISLEKKKEQSKKKKSRKDS
jgi:hypothetical protein